jgi:hypothetical protein
MCVPARDGKRDWLMTIGFVFLVLANSARLVFRHTPSIGEDLADGLHGLLFGVAIGSLLLAIWRRGPIARRP